MRKPVEAINSIPFFASFKWLFILGTVGFLFYQVVITKHAFKDTQKQEVSFERANIEKVEVGQKSEEKLWYWEFYVEGGLENKSDRPNVIFGTRMGRKF